MRIKYGLMVMAAFFITATAQNFKSAHFRDIALMPQQNDCRNVLDLSGIWKFKVDSADIGEKSKWYDGLNGTRQIAVPGSWNDQFTDLHNYLSASWYETSTFIPSSWRGQDIYIRVGSAVYNAKLWINGRPVGMHEGGFVPFAFDISDDVKWNEENRIVIRVENELKLTRVPLGGNKSGAMSSQKLSKYQL
jgi:beta-glucuronidase